MHGKPGDFYHFYHHVGMLLSAELPVTMADPSGSRSPPSGASS
jgi:hypothetical protein